MSDGHWLVLEQPGTLNEDGTVTFKVLEGAENLPTEWFEITEDMIYNPYEEEPDIY